MEVSGYPELFALMGGKVPDLRGLFLRGYGSQSHVQNNGSTVGVTSTTHASGALGQVQGDAIRNITGTFGSDDQASAHSSGVFFKGGFSHTGGAENDPSGYYVKFDISRQVPTANENRPVNWAVRYLVRARP